MRSNFWLKRSETLLPLFRPTPDRPGHLRKPLLSRICISSSRDDSFVFFLFLFSLSSSLRICSLEFFDIQCSCEASVKTSTAGSQVNGLPTNPILDFPLTLELIASSHLCFVKKVSCLSLASARHSQQQHSTTIARRPPEDTRRFCRCASLQDPRDARAHITLPPKSKGIIGHGNNRARKVSAHKNLRTSIQNVQS